MQAELWEIAENLHRCDLTKEQRDEHIRRYAELLEKRRSEILPQNAAKLKTPENPKGAGRPQGVVREVAEQTGLSVDTVRRALKPKVVDIKSALEPESDHDAIIREANAISVLPCRGFTSGGGGLTLGATTTSPSTKTADGLFDGECSRVDYGRMTQAFPSKLELSRGKTPTSTL